MCLPFGFIAIIRVAHAKWCIGIKPQPCLETRKTSIFHLEDLGLDSVVISERILGKYDGKF
jgi:hypothetical protein